MLPVEVSNVELAFGGSIRTLMPKYQEVPEEFKKFHGNKWIAVVDEWFFRGLSDNAEFKPKKGIDQSKALRHISAIMRSWEPKHEHKIAACAYLLSEWFDDVINYKEKKS